MAENTEKPIKLEPQPKAAPAKDSPDYDAALSASLNSLFENGFVASEDAAAEEKKIFAETVTYLELPEAEEEVGTAAEPDPEEVKDIDDNVFNNIDSALASQIAVEIKKEKRLKAKRRPKWWLLSLIPVLGILIIFIHPISKYMPKWFMALRTLVFACFAVVVMFVVASEGELACLVAVRSVKNNFGSKLDQQTDLSAELKNIHFVEGTRVENQQVHMLCILKDDYGKTQLLALAGTNSADGSLTVQFLDKDTDLASLSYEIDGWILMDSKVVSLLANRIGGIEVVLNAGEAEFINGILKENRLKSGRQTIMGETARAYFLCSSSINGLEEGDESLLEHQKRFLEEVNNYMTDKSMHNRFFTINECIPYVQTNLPESLMIELLGQKNFTLKMLTPMSTIAEEQL